MSDITLGVKRHRCREVRSLLEASIAQGARIAYTESYGVFYRTFKVLGEHTDLLPLLDRLSSLKIASSRN